MIDSTIGYYTISEELGRGGMAVVYRAHDPRFNRDVAIKVLPAVVQLDPTFRQRFEREAQTIARLEHSAIVPVHDFGEHEGQPYLVMRYMSGGSLAERIAGGPLTLGEASRIVDRIGSALDAAHARAIIHRDVKPGNILFDSYGDAYLSDFGIVRLTEVSTHLTGSGLIGTPAYMAPEMTHKGGLTDLIDVYALGVTLFEILSGHQPYQADTPMGTALAHATNPIPIVHDIRPGLPEQIQQVIDRALAKDPAERYQSAGELAEGLRQALDGTSVEVSEIEAALPRETRPEVDRTLLEVEPTRLEVEPAEAAAPAITKPKARTLWPLIAGLGLGGIAAIIVGVIGLTLLIVTLWPDPIPTPAQRPATAIAAATEVPPTEVPPTKVVPTEVPRTEEEMEPETKPGEMGNLGPIEVAEEVDPSLPVFDLDDGYDTTLVQLIDTNVPYTASFSSVFDAHNWLFEGTAGQDIEVFATGDGVDTRARLIDPSGVLLVEEDDTMGTDPWITVTLPVNGLYTIRMDTWSTGAYVLIVTESEGVTVPSSSSGAIIEQWAVSATASSQYGSTNWSASRATGEADTFDCGDYNTAWATASSTGIDWLQLDYATPVYSTGVVIYESYNPGAITDVIVIGVSGTEYTVYSGQPQIEDLCPVTWTIEFSGVDEMADSVVLHLDQTNHSGWNEIDAVKLIGTR